MPPRRGINQAADKEYRGPYGTPVDEAPLIPAIEGDAGRVGTSAAYKDADALRLPDQMDELAKLKTAANPEPVPTPVATIGGDVISSPSLEAKNRAALGLDAAPEGDGTVPVSLGTLDRIKIALNDAGEEFNANGKPARAAGFFSRAKEIDDHLAANNDDYATARDNYSRASAGIDAVDHGQSAMDARPDDYAVTLRDLRMKGGSDAAGLAAVGHRQALTDAIGRPSEGATGVLNRISTSTNQGRNLAETFGPDEGAAYQGGIKDLVDQVNNARFVNPNTNSASAGRLLDQGLVEPPDVSLPRVSGLNIVLGAINKIRAGATLTDGERQAIARIGTTRADPSSLNLAELPALTESPELQHLRALTAAMGTTDQDPNRANSQ